MRLYVATKWEEKEMAHELIQSLQKRGHEITHDWTTVVQEGPHAAEDDINGVKAADAVVAILYKDLKYVGALIEIGAALGQGKPVYILGDAPVTHTLFLKHHPLVKKITCLCDITGEVK